MALIKDIENILNLDVQHISCYSLTVHENTVFGIKHIEEPTDDLSRELYDTINEILESKGFEHYEISNWSKPGYESKHNLTYWKDQQYYGVGLGASGFVGKIRYTNTKSISEYIKFKNNREEEIVSREEDEEYFIMLNLRTKYGINFAEFKDRFGIDFLDKYSVALQKLLSNGLLVKTNDAIIPTYNGMMILDQIVLDLLTN